MKKAILLSLIAFMLLTIGCSSSDHFLTDAKYRAQVEQDFQAKQKLLPQGNLFSVFNDKTLSVKEREALTFLYAYLPVGDIADYDGSFYLQNVRTSFEAQKAMPWGNKIPEDIFRHFVLPVRVNNENMDSSRMVFFKELKDRVKGMSLEQAALEVNHWCHEKVIYTPSDGRTSSPLASIKTAYGRCGEESTFAVAALRSVCIPARQVYTPRWAHTDDNHAWVEVWINGKWHFMGACEPAPILNMAWFNGPVYRGMLEHTKVFGRYTGPEEVMSKTPSYTEINVTSNYAPVAKATVRVVDKDGKAVAGADVQFKLFNYAEFSTVATKVADDKGETSLSAGKGDMLVWADKDGHYGFGKLSFGKMSELTIKLDKLPGDTSSLSLDLVPPVEGAIAANPTEAQTEENNRRMAQEDSIRNAYVATFITPEQAAAFAKEENLPADKIVELMAASRGNWKTLKDFLSGKAARDNRTDAMNLLDAISQKDLRDISLNVLQDHLMNTIHLNDAGDLFAKYVLNPRVSNEMVVSYKSFFRAKLDSNEAKGFQSNPATLVEWVKKNITINNDINPQHIPVMPTGVWKARVADEYSRNIFFVSMARSLGIPARIDPVAGKVQYAVKGAWNSVDFETASTVSVPTGMLVATYKPSKIQPDPHYMGQFTVASIGKNGTPQTLSLSRGNADPEMGTWSGLLKTPLAMDEGAYMLVSGSRMASGGVLAQVQFFNIKAGQTTKIPLIMREDTTQVAVIGNFNSENKYQTTDGKETSILLTTGRGYFIVAILGANQEPTNHALRDIAAVKQKLEAWGRPMVLLFPDQKGFSAFNPKEFGALPKTISYGIDANHAIEQELVKNMRLSASHSYPIFIIGDTFNRVVFCSQGYTIGLGEQLMKAINGL